MIKFTTVEELREHIFKLPLDQYVMVQIGDKEVVLKPDCEHRMRQIAEETDASMVYSYYRERLDSGEVVPLFLALKFMYLKLRIIETEEETEQDLPSAGSF